MKNILINTTSFDKKNILNFKNKSKLKLIFNKTKRRLTEEELLKLVNENTVGIISGTELITKKILNRAKNLQVISRCGTGTDNIDKLAFKKKIKIYKTSKEPSTAVAEFVICQILVTLKKSILNHTNVKNNKWEKVQGTLLSNKNIGIIGYGNIGKKLHKLLKPFNCTFSIYDPKITKYKKKKILINLLKKSDIISIHIPFSEKNKNFINKKKLDLMKDDAVIVNCARGGLIDENALEKKIKKNPKLKVILDCFSKEPYKGRLLKYNNVLFSPHVSSFSKETRDLMEKNSFKNCIDNLRI
jgi:D-3-phosphoglycerate dehydrogenase